MAIAFLHTGHTLWVCHDGKVTTTLLHTSSLADILNGAAARLGRASAEATVIIETPDAFKVMSAQVKGSRAGDWRMVGANLQPWSTFLPDGAKGPAFHVGFLGALKASTGAPFLKSDTPQLIVRSLSWFHHAVGAPWHMTAGVAGCASIRGQHFPRSSAAPKDEPLRPYWGIGSRRPIADERRAAGDILWDRALTTPELHSEWVHCYDLNAARLAAAGVAGLPWYKLEHSKDRLFDPKLAGYWQVRAEEVPRWNYRPALIPDSARHNRHGLVWLTTPIMEELCRIGINPEVLDSYTSAAKRWLERWAKRINLARVDTIVRHGKNTIPYKSLQSVWKETFGMIERDGGSISVPLVAHTVIDRQRATLLSHIDRVFASLEVLPFKVLNDALWYVSDNPDHRHAIPLPQCGPAFELGKFKHVYTVPMAIWLEWGHEGSKEYAKNRSEKNAAL